MNSHSVWYVDLIPSWVYRRWKFTVPPFSLSSDIDCLTSCFSSFLLFAPIRLAGPIDPYTQIVLDAHTSHRDYSSLLIYNHNHHFHPRWSTSICHIILRGIFRQQDVHYQTSLLSSCNPTTAKMLARSAKPKLTISLATGPAQSARPALSLKSPMGPMRSPRSPMPNSPTSMNTKMNQRGLTTLQQQQQPTYAYTNTSTSRSILKKGQAAKTACRHLQFSAEPVVHCVTPIEDAEYYGAYKKMTRDERRWTSRSWFECLDSVRTDGN